MSWIVLVIAGLLEVVWAIGLKYTHGFTRLTPSVITIAAMIVSIVMLSWAMRTLPVGTAYAVCHYRHSAAGGVCESGAYRQPRVNRRGYHRVKTQYPLMRLFYPD
jgi:multidrug transporter EmrE-like cation transporter